MNLNARVSRMETYQGYSNPPQVIVAEDEQDFDQRFEEALLGCRPGLLSLSGSVGGVPFKAKITIPTHEERVELLL